MSLVHVKTAYHHPVGRLLLILLVVKFKCTHVLYKSMIIYNSQIHEPSHVSFFVPFFILLLPQGDNFSLFAKLHNCQSSFPQFYVCPSSEFLVMNALEHFPCHVIILFLTQMSIWRGKVQISNILKVQDFLSDVSGIVIALRAK